MATEFTVVPTYHLRQKLLCCYNCSSNIMWDASLAIIFHLISHTAYPWHFMQEISKQLIPEKVRMYFLLISAFDLNPFK
jgi:hypothetical protein